MTPSTLGHQLLLFIHLLIFALALSEVLRGDLNLLKNRTLDPDWLHRVSRQILVLLTLLWISGGALFAISAAPDPSVLLTNPKLATKLFVVTLLTLNGLLLHTVAFPMLLRRANGAAAVASMLGAVSTGSWLYASFVGVSRVIAPETTMSVYLSLYGLVLSGGIIIALVIIRPQVREMLGVGAETAPDEGKHLSRSRSLPGIAPPDASVPRNRLRQGPGSIAAAVSLGTLLFVILLSGLPMGTWRF
jgi:hypothetical protein